MTTYRKLAQIISDTYYRGISNDDVNLSLRYFAELVAQEVANFTTIDAFQNSKLGEATYANDQFISVFKGVAIAKLGDELYSILPATPAGLPKNREITEVSIIGNKCLNAIPHRNYSSFTQSLIGIPNGMVLYKIESGKLIFETNNPLFDITNTVNIKMVGAVSGIALLDSELNIPKDVESKIKTKILGDLLPLKQIPQDLINDGVSNPS